MTEDEYIDVRDITRVRVATETLRSVLAGEGRAISQAEHETVMSILYKWEEALSDRISTDESS